MEERVLYEDRVRADLRVFQALLNRRPEELVTILGKFQSGRPPTGRDTWYAWLDKPAQLSCVAYLKVVETIREHHSAAEDVWPAPADPPADLERRIAAIEPRPSVKRSARKASG